jgi:hypothetical protein
MVAGAAGQYLHRIDLSERLGGVHAEQLGYQRPRTDHHLQCRRDRARLLEDLLLHVMAVGPELDCIRRQLAFMHRSCRRGTGSIDDAKAIGVELGDVAFFEIHDTLGDLQQRGGVARAEVLFFAQPEQQRRALARDHQTVRGWLREHRDRICAFQFGGRLLHRREQVAGLSQAQVNQMRDDLGVGVRFERVAGAGKPDAYGFMVLDDAVMHDCQAILADMRMRVALARCAVGGPSRVGDAQRSLRSGLLGNLGKAGHPSDAAQPVQAAVDDRHAGGVVSAVLELA